MAKASVVSTTPGTATLLSQFNPEQAIELQVLCRTFRQTQERMGRDLFILTTTLNTIKEITGDGFGEFAQQMLNINPRTLRRYMHIHSVCETHFSVNGRVDPAEVGNISQRAFALLEIDTSEDVITEIRSRSQNGQIIDEGTVRELLNSQSDNAVQVEALKAEVKKVAQTAEESITALKLQNLQLMTQSNAHAEIIKNLTDMEKSLQEELASAQAALNTAKAESTQVHYVDKVVEVLPPGYASAEEAVAKKQDELAKVTSELEILQQKQIDAADKVKLLNAGVDEFLKMKAQIEDIVMKYPKTLISAVASSDPAIKTSMKGMASALTICADHISSAIA